MGNLGYIGLAVGTWDIVRMIVAYMYSHLARTGHYIRAGFPIVARHIRKVWQAGQGGATTYPCPLLLYCYKGGVVNCAATCVRVNHPLVLKKNLKGCSVVNLDRT